MGPALIRGPKLIMAVYKPVFEYADYCQKSGKERALADFWYDFSHGETAVSKLLWMGISAVVGAVVGYFLH